MDILKKIENEHTSKSVYYFPAIIFLISLFFNLFYFNWKDAPMLRPDSSSYIQFANKISQWQIPDISHRTPTYPLYLLAFFGNLKLAAITQLVIGSLSNVLLYLIGIKLFKRPWLVFLAVIVISSDYFIASFNSFILTECLSTFLLLLSLYFHILILTKNTAKKIFALAIISDTLLIFVRPNLFLLPIFILVFTLCYFFLYEKRNEESRKIKIFSVSSIILNVFFIFSWCYLNLFQNNYFTISRIGDINILGKLLQYDIVKENENSEIIPEPARKVTELNKQFSLTNPNTSSKEESVQINFKNDNTIFSQIINELKIIKWHYIYPKTKLLRNYLSYEDQYKTNPYDIFNALSKTSENHLAEIKTANSYFFNNNKKEFFLKTLRNTPKVMMISGDYSSLPNNLSRNKLLSPIIKTFYIFNIIAKVSPLTMLMCVLYFLYLIFKRKKEKIAILGIIILSILYVVFSISALSYEDYSRLRMPAVPLIELLTILMLLLLTKKLFYFFSKLKVKK